MPYIRRTLTQLLADAINDLTLALGSTPLPSDPAYFIAQNSAGQVWELYGYLDYISRQCTPFTAEGEFMEAWAALKNVYRIDAQYASGSVAFTGLNGTVVPAGTVISRADQVAYATLDDYTIGTSTSVEILAQGAGAAGNALSNTAVTLTSPIGGVSSSATILAPGAVGGADQEGDLALRSRMLVAYAQQPTGGNASDYPSWALSLGGVTRAWVYPRGLGPGSVVVYAMLDGNAFNGFPQGSNGGSSTETRIAPATGDQLLIANAIAPLQPVTALVYVAAPIAQPINITINNMLPNTVAMQAAVQTSLTNMFTSIGNPTGMKVYNSDISAAISNTPGIASFELFSPTTAITVPVGSIPVLGTVTFG